MIDPKELANRFIYHPPSNHAVASYHEALRTACLNLAQELNEALPDGREKALAVTHLEQVMFWGNAAIARHPLNVPS